MLRHEVILAAATALWNGNMDCTHPSSDGVLDKKDRQRGENVVLAGTEELVADLEKDVVRILDLMEDLMEDTNILCAILLQAEAIARDDMNCLLTTEDIRVMRMNNSSRVWGFAFLICLLSVSGILTSFSLEISPRRETSSDFFWFLLQEGPFGPSLPFSPLCFYFLLRIFLLLCLFPDCLLSRPFFFLFFFIFYFF